jgi:hypothetical protein
MFIIPPKGNSLNHAAQHPEIVQEQQTLMKKIRAEVHSTPRLINWAKETE